MADVRRVAFACCAFLLAVAALSPMASGTVKGTATAYRILDRSPIVSLRYWMEHPSRAPVHLRDAFRALPRAVAAAPRRPTERPVTAPGAPLRFTRDGVGMPQAETALAVCRNDPNVILGGTNDLRGGVVPSFHHNIGGWHLSTDGGASLDKEGPLPSVRIDGLRVHAGGDPVVDVDEGCDFFASNIAYRLDFLGGTRASGIAVYRTSAGRLRGDCTDESCWPTRRVVASTTNRGQFLDKQWMAVGRSGGRNVVWVTYTRFAGMLSKIEAVRCNRALTVCTDPIPISPPADRRLEATNQFSYVVIGPDQRTYVVWAHITIRLRTALQNEQVIKMRVAEPGSTEFGPVRVVAEVPNAQPISGVPHAATFRYGSLPAMEVVRVGTRERVYVTWPECAPLQRATDVCEEPVIQLAQSDDRGRTWTERTVSDGGDNYFPTISADREGPNMALSWYSTRVDPLGHHRMIIRLATIDAATGAVVRRRTASAVPIEPDADPTFRGAFIGDYFQVIAHRNTAYVHFTANYTRMQYLRGGRRIPQLDNFLSVVPMT